MGFTYPYISATDSFCLDYSTNFLGHNSIKKPDKDTTSILVDTVYTVLVQEDIAPARPPPPRDKADLQDRPPQGQGRPYHPGEQLVRALPRRHLLSYGI